MRTSNFFIKGLDPNAVSISRITPPWYKDMCYEPLAPPINLVQGYMSGAISETYFSQAYKKRVLDTPDPFELIKDLGMNAILLGNAPPGNFVIGDWLPNGWRKPWVSRFLSAENRNGCGLNFNKHNQLK